MAGPDQNNTVKSGNSFAPVTPAEEAAFAAGHFRPDPSPERLSTLRNLFKFVSENCPDHIGEGGYEDFQSTYVHLDRDNDQDPLGFELQQVARHSREGKPVYYAISSAGHAATYLVSAEDGACILTRGHFDRTVDQYIQQVFESFKVKAHTQNRERNLAFKSAIESFHDYSLTPSEERIPLDETHPIFATHTKLFLSKSPEEYSLDSEARGILLQHLRELLIDEKLFHQYSAFVAHLGNREAALDDNILKDRFAMSVIRENRLEELTNEQLHQIMGSVLTIAALATEIGTLNLEHWIAPRMNHRIRQESQDSDEAVRHLTERVLKLLSDRDAHGSEESKE